MENNDISGFYLPPDVFFEEVLRCKIKGEISQELGRMFLLLAEKTTQHRSWVRYHHIKQDMISEAVLVCVGKGFQKYKPFQDMSQWDGKTMVKYSYLTCWNPHAWFTKCIFNQLKGFMKSEYGVTNVRNKIRLDNGLETTYGYDQVLENEFEQKNDDDTYNGADNDNSSDDFNDDESEVVICDYEGDNVDER
ncbi:hypothetical protein [Alishewanella phage vB_AspM_Slickus01]|nr:hypothetical protein [Alishewanella phage vB_AspM_Slickus01]